MNLIVDIGNTSTKFAIYDSGKKLLAHRIKDLKCHELENILGGHLINKAILSSVKKIPPFIHDLFFSNIEYVHELSYESKLPFRIEYETPETLGADRIAAAAGAYNIFPEKELLIIDAGSALTFDYLSAGIFRGGNISPGLSMRFKALHKFTDKLPLISTWENYSSPGRNTPDAIVAGVITGLTYEINEYIRTFENNQIDFTTVLTGGDSEFLRDKIKYNVNYMPDIVSDGLNYILDYNAK